MDANEIALNKHLQKQQDMEKFLSMFEDDIQVDLETIRVTMKRLRNKSKDYYGFDFSCECEDFIQDLF